MVSFGKLVENSVAAKNVYDRLGYTRAESKLLYREYIVVIAGSGNLLCGGFAKTGKRVKGHTDLSVLGQECRGVRLMQINVKEHNSSCLRLSYEIEGGELLVFLGTCVVTLFLYCFYSGTLY